MHHGDCIVPKTCDDGRDTSLNIFVSEPRRRLLQADGSNKTVGPIARRKTELLDYIEYQWQVKEALHAKVTSIGLVLGESWKNPAFPIWTLISTSNRQTSSSDEMHAFSENSFLVDGWERCSCQTVCIQ
jgi:hypothetical protein